MKYDTGSGSTFFLPDVIFRHWLKSYNLSLRIWLLSQYWERDPIDTLGYRMSYGRSVNYLREEMHVEAQSGEEDESESEEWSETQQLWHDFPEFHHVECWPLFADIPGEIICRECVKRWGMHG